MYTPIHIKRENQYTDGTEYMIYAQPYIGFYNITSQGPYTGRVFDEGRSEELYKLEFVDSISAQTYLDLISTTGYVPDLEFDDPMGVYITPDDKDYARGFIVRYFIQQRNDTAARIREVNKKQFDNLSDPGAGLNSSFYKGITLRWKLTGPLNDILRNGVIAEPGVSDTNKRTIKQKEFSMSGIERFLQNRLSEFSEYDPRSSMTNTDIQL
tara:strand:+ start:10918 stop:11550 length:633 start_codon:yes stop_codon:yes gene_type:complete